MRSLRKLMPNARYHVTARANRKEFIFNSPWVKEMFEAIIERAKKKYSFRIENFTIMGNHFHLIIQPGPKQNLSRIMQWIMSRFATAFNRALGLTGHVWGDRFYSAIINSFRDLVHAFDYIDYNPVKACLVTSPQSWKFGGLYQARRGRYRVVDRLWDWMFLHFSGHRPLQISAF